MGGHGAGTAAGHADHVHGERHAALPGAVRTAVRPARARLLRHREALRRAGRAVVRQSGHHRDRGDASAAARAGAVSGRGGGHGLPAAHRHRPGRAHGARRRRRRGPRRPHPGGSRGGRCRPAAPHAEQLELTLTGLQSVKEVEVTVAGAQLSTSGDDGPAPVQTDPAVGSVQVGIDTATGGLVYVQGTSVTPVGGAPDVTALDPVRPTMSGDRSRFAFVTRDRTAVHVAGTDGSLREALRGTGLTVPSLDLLGWVWAADRGTTSRIRAVPAQPGGQERIVTATWLRPGERIVDLRLSRSGARAAILVDDGQRTTLRVSGVVRGSDGVPNALTEPILLPSSGSEDSVEWAGDTNLLVSAYAEKPDERVVPRIVSIDGTVRELNPLGGLRGISVGDDGAYYAETDEFVFLLVGSSWRAQELDRGVRDLSFPD
ncbi:hypothetical protein B8X03_04225 [Micrococcus luteus]|nr:hypothetical protein B8X03_04225 [Micrococcus luteus]